jgi:hypothetical protein
MESLFHIRSNAIVHTLNPSLQVKTKTKVGWMDGWVYQRRVSKSDASDQEETVGPMALSIELSNAMILRILGVLE